MKYKVHSLISALCLAVGIVCYTLVAYWINAYNSMINMHDEEVVTFKLEDEDGRWSLFTPVDVERIEDLHIDGLSDITVKFPSRQAEIDVIDKDQKEKPFIVFHSMDWIYCMVTVFRRKRMKSLYHVLLQKRLLVKMIRLGL